MIQLNFIEKIQALLDIVKSSSLFIILSMVLILLIAILISGYKKNKKINEKIFIGTFVMLITFVIFKYSTNLIELGDNFIEEIVTAIYFPNIAVYSLSLVTVNGIMLYTLIKNKFYIHKISSVISALIMDFLFILTLDTVVTNNIDIYQKLTVYSNKQLLVLIELTTIIFTIWTFITLFVKICNKTINSNVEVPSLTEQSVKEIPSYVIPTPIEVGSNQFMNDTLAHTLEPVKNSTYAVNFTPDELYNRFKSGEQLTKEQYMVIKNYLMTK